MTNENTGAAKVWKQADNKVTVIGLVAENNLEIRDFDEWKDGVQTGSKYKAITGDLVVRSGDNENHQIRFFSKQFTNAGAESRQFTGLQTVAESVVSIADTEKNAELKPTKVSVQASMALNEYVGADEMMRSFPSIEGRFVNRLEEGDALEGKAEFDLEGLVGKVMDEFKNDEETGRKIVTLLVPLYNSVVPLEFKVDAGDGASYIEDNFENGTSVRVYGDIVNFQDNKEVTTPMGFGEDKVETVTTYVRENLIKGGNLYEEDVHPAKIIDAGLVKEKLVQREKHLENLKTRAQQRKQQGNDKPKTGFGSGTSGGFGQAAKVPNPLDNKGEEIDLTGMF